METAEKKMTVSEIKRGLEKDPSFLLLRAVDILAQAEKAEADLVTLTQAKASVEQEIKELSAKHADQDRRFLTAKTKYSSEIADLEKLKASRRDGLIVLHDELEKLRPEVARMEVALAEERSRKGKLLTLAELTAEIDAKRQLLKREQDRLTSIQKSVRLAELQQAKA